MRGVFMVVAPAGCSPPVAVILCYSREFVPPCPGKCCEDAVRLPQRAIDFCGRSCAWCPHLPGCPRMAAPEPGEVAMESQNPGGLFPATPCETRRTIAATAAVGQPAASSLADSVAPKRAASSG